MTSGKELFTLKGNGKQSYAASFSADGARIVTTGVDNHVVTVWDAGTGEELAVLKGHTRATGYAAFSPDGTKVATGSDDGTARIWVLPTRSKYPRLADIGDWAPDGMRLLSRVGDVSVVTDTRTQQVVRLEDSASVRGRAFSPDGKLVIGARYPQFARPAGDTSPEQAVAVVWDAASGKKLCTVPGHAVEWSANRDGTRLLTAFANGTVHIWDTSGREVAVLTGHIRRVLKAWWSADGSRVVTAVSSFGPGPQGFVPLPEDPLRVWDVATGREVTTLKVTAKPAFEYSQLSWSPDGSKIATRADETTRVWDARTGQELWATEVPNGYRWVAWSSTSAYVLESDRSAICVRDGTTGEIVNRLGGHIGIPCSASYSPDGSRLATTSLDNTLRVWDARSGAEMLALKCSMSPMEPVIWSSDGASFVIRQRRVSFGGGRFGGNEKVPEIWDARPTDPRFRTPAANEPKR